MSDEVKTRMQLRDALAALFTLEFEHLPAQELLSESAAAFVVCAILYGLEKKDALEITSGAFDQLEEHKDQILSLHLPTGTIAEA
mgnify:CR=1 FL=1|tara:strand:- start:342 stop:596 length:255 start_codon:yes stop_codon:yes gene_type:complete